MKAKVRPGVRFDAGTSRNAGYTERAAVRGLWHVRCIGADGHEKWEENYENLVVNTGLSYLLQAGLDNQTQITAWYVGLTSATPTIAAGDTMASHAGWTEFTAYDEAARQAWTGGTESGQSIDNSASVAVFTCSTNSSSVGGAFLASVDTKGGTTGTLYAAGAFSSNKALDDGDVLNVTATFTMADDGV
jgi:hypothetical protein